MPTKMHDKQKKAVVIGSGFGGLALAIRLQAAGFQTTIYEKRDLPGGRAYVFNQDGFTFDAGPTVITAPHCLEELFESCGKEMKDYITLKPVHPFYRLMWEDGTVLDYSNDDKALKEQIDKISPGDWEGYKEFLKYSEEVFKAGYEDLVHVPFLNFFSMIKAAPDLIKLQAYRSVYSMVSKYIKEDHLRQAFSFHSLLIGGNPFNASSIYTLIHKLERQWGVLFPEGGTHALVRALVKLFEEEGGKIFYNSEINEVLSSNGSVVGVQLQDGRIHQCDLVASNADVAHTYKDLLRETEEVERNRKKVMNSSYSMSLFVTYFGTNRTWDNLKHHNILFGNRYKGLLKDIFKTGKLSDDFSIYLHSPTLSDPSLAPDGHHSFYALSPVPHLGKSNVNWETEGPKYAERIMDYMEKNYMPGLKDSVVTQLNYTPIDFKNDLNAHLGSAFSIEPVLHQSAYFRAHNRDKYLNGMYIVGAGTHPGAGVPGVVNSAKATFGVIKNDYPAVSKNREVVLRPNPIADPEVQLNEGPSL